MHESYIKQYVNDSDFQDVYENLSKGSQSEELDYHVHSVENLEGFRLIQILFLIITCDLTCDTYVFFFF